MERLTTARSRRRETRRRSACPRPSARSRGQAMVEFALIAPLFFLLLFGIIEFSLINASVAAFNFSVKEAARYEAIIGNGSAPGYVWSDDYIVNQVIVPHINGLVMAKLTQIIIYRANETGGCAGTGQLPSCQTQVVETNNGGTWSCGTTCSNWPPTSRNDQLSNADYIGVYAAYSYTYLTAFFAVTSPTINLTALSVQRIEPQQYGKLPASAPIASVGASGAGGLPMADLLSLLAFPLLAPRRNVGLLTGERA